MKNQAKTQKQTYFQDSFESDRPTVGNHVKSLSKDTVRAMWEDFFKASARKNLPEQILNTKNESKNDLQTEVVLKEAEEIILNAQKQDQKEQKLSFSRHQEYFRRDVETAELKKNTQETAENEKRIDMVKAEIRKLIKAQKEMEAAFKQVSATVTVESTPQEASTYDVNFFDWVLLTIRQARMKVEEGKTWLSLFASKKGQMKYWSQAKSKGTSFTLHHDRAVATQVG